MTFDDDIIRWESPVFGTVAVRINRIGLEWPPPERIILDGTAAREAREGDDPTCILRRISMSGISDEDRTEMTHVARGAEYVYEMTTEAVHEYGRSRE